MKKAVQILEDILLFIPAVIAVLVMCIYGIFARDDDFDPYI